jgi:hypothetical protein
MAAKVSDSLAPVPAVPVAPVAESMVTAKPEADDRPDAKTVVVVRIPVVIPIAVARTIGARVSGARIAVGAVIGASRCDTGTD